MAKEKRTRVEDLRGMSRLAVEATKSIIDLIQEMHVTISAGPDLLGRPLEGPARAITEIFYGGVREVTHLVGEGLDFALGQLTPLLGESLPGPEREAVLAVLNGVLGDYLEESGNPLAISMRLRSAGESLTLETAELRQTFPHASGKVLVLIHGSSSNDLQWNRLGNDHGQRLSQDLGYTPLYLLYNTGRHVSVNGQELCGILEALVENWPAPLKEISLLGHSMGGLVARSACHYGETQAWRRKLKNLICLGSPHHGSPLERSGNQIEMLLGVSRYSAPLARLSKIRSAGITDMRFGNVLDDHWHGRDRFAFGNDPRQRLELPGGVACFTVAGTTAPKPRAKLPSDGLVPVDSALGKHENPNLTLGFPEAHQLVAYATNHLDLLNRESVYETLRDWLSKS